MNSKKISKICNNCGRNGHKIFECTLPSISIGIILYRINNGVRQYLMIRRNSSFGYLDLLKRKKYDIDILKDIIDELTIHEKEVIYNKYINDTDEYSKEVIKYILNSKTSWCEPEWGFPKGRRNPGEKDLECAMREFEEESGYLSSTVDIIENIIPYEELFVGSNKKLYKQKYYLAFINNNIDILDNYQKSEVSKVAWYNIDECKNVIRNYNIEKIDIINNVDISLDKYKLIKI
jgi:8-oxo-dGTP pyrophosphatase MutT (NUDIX family)